MDAAMEQGFSIPDDFAVIGHNNNPNGLRSNPPLSTMLLPYDHVAKGMIGHALALSAGRSGQLKVHEPQAFYIRESCGGRARLGVHQRHRDQLLCATHFRCAAARQWEHPGLRRTGRKTQ